MLFMMSLYLFSSIDVRVLFVRFTQYCTFTTCRCKSAESYTLVQCTTWWPLCLSWTIKHSTMQSCCHCFLDKTLWDHSLQEFALSSCNYNCCDKPFSCWWSLWHHIAETLSRILPHLDECGWRYFVVAIQGNACFEMPLRCHTATHADKSTDFYKWWRRTLSQGNWLMVNQSFANAV